MSTTIERLGGLSSNYPEQTEQSSHTGAELNNAISTFKLSIIIPVYNEESKISSLIKNIKANFSEAKLEYEIIVIDDGSTDNTIRNIQEEERLDCRVKYMSYKKNMGKGYAVKLGVLKSEGDIVLFLDGDLDISPNEIRNYVKELESCDLVIASKAHPLSNVTCPAHRRLLSRMYNVLVRLAVGIKVKDTQSGLKAGNGNALRKIFEIMLVKRYAFDVELLALATRLNLKINELPVNITLDSSFRIREILKMFIDTLGISYRLRITNFYQRSLGATSEFIKSEALISRVALK